MAARETAARTTPSPGFTAVRRVTVPLAAARRRLHAVSSHGGADGESVDGAGATTAVIDVAATPRPDGPESESTGDSAAVTALRDALLAACVGLDRGLSSTAAQRATVDAAATKLEAAARGMRAWAAEELGDALSGRWELLYSSSFGSGSLGGSRAGPPVGGILQLGPVYQRIQPRKGRLDNIVDVTLRPPLPFLPAAAVTVILGHEMRLLGNGAVRITSDAASLRTRGGPLKGWRPLAAPPLPEFLRPPSALRSATFDVTFVDGRARVSRGDRGELRVFVR